MKSLKYYIYIYILIIFVHLPTYKLLSYFIIWTSAYKFHYAGNDNPVSLSFMPHNAVILELYVFISSSTVFIASVYGPFPYLMIRAISYSVSGYSFSSFRLSSFFFSSFFASLWASFIDDESI